MDLFDVVRACVRRWYVVVPVIVITLGIAGSTYAFVKPVYYVNAVVGIAPPNLQFQYSSDTPIPRNGLLDAGGPALIANMAVLALDDSSIRDQIVGEGGKRDFTVRMFPSPLTGAGSVTQLPLIMIEASEKDPASATKTVQLVTAKADFVMQQLQRQAGVDELQIVRALTVSPPTTPLAGIPSRAKSVILIVAVGSAFAVVLGVLSDIVLERRKARREVAGSDPLSLRDEPESLENSERKNEVLNGDTVVDDR